jgi:K+-sensing histidine kinase KdpD
MAMGVRCRKVHACLKGVPSIAVSIGLILAVTALLWEIKSTTSGSYGLVYVYLFPVSLIAALYNGPLAVLSAAVALLCADFFLQPPLYSFVNDNPLEYGDLVAFALLAVTAIVRSRISAASPKSPQGRIALPPGLNHFPA